MSYRKEVILWATFPHVGQDNQTHPGATAGGYSIDSGGAVETHGGENSGAAQARFAPRNGKYAQLPGLRWMNDVKAFGGFWSGHSADPVVGGGASGQVNNFDYVCGGPSTRMEHVHVIDCAGYDTLQLHWQGRCLGYEGLSIADANVMALYTGALCNLVIGDAMSIQAVGMPSIDSRDELYSIPKMMRLNANDSLANEGGGGAFTSNPTFTVNTGSDVVTVSNGGLRNNDIVRVSTTNTLPNDGIVTHLAINTPYYVINAAADGNSCQLSASLGGAAINFTSAGVGTHTMITPATYPGGGRNRGVPMRWGASETGVHWEPDYWISGTNPLFVQWRPIGYPTPTVDNWMRYDLVRPATSFEGSGFNNMQSASGPTGVLQWGKVFKDAQDIMKSYKWTQAGDKLEATCMIGYPNRTFQSSSAAGGFTTYINSGSPMLSIKGLARIALVFGSIRASWHGEGINGGLCYDQATRANAAGGSTCLATSPVAPAVAPRQHIRGVWKAILSSDTTPS